MITDIADANDRDLSRIASLLGDRVTENEPLAQYTTYRVGGAAALFMRVLTVEDLHSLSRALSKVKVPVVVIGRGSNMLVSDRGFRGIAVTLGPFAELINLPTVGESPIVIAGAMAPLPVLARQSVHHGLTGLEWAVGVPGAIGGAVRMNAGGHGADMIASLLSVRLFHIERGIEANVSAADLGLRFRGSDLTDDHVVLSATLRLSWGDTIVGQARLSEIVKWRRENQPGGQNAGSVFVNPVAGVTSAGELIDELGLRGYRIHSASVSDKHANFIQSDEGGSADDVVELMTFVRQRVSEAHGIDLRSEIRLVGFPTPVSSQAGAQTLKPSNSNSQLDAVFGVSNSPDSSLPVPVVSEKLSDDVLEELKDAFEGDATPISIFRVTKPDVHVVEYELDDKLEPIVKDSTTFLDSDIQAVVEISKIETVALETDVPGRIVIIDEELRLPTDSTFPIDARTETVHIAPSSATFVIIDDAAADVEREATLKRSFQKRTKYLIFGSAFFVVVALVLIVLASPIISVRDVEIEGSKYMNKDLLVSVEQSLLGKPLLTVDTREASRRLEDDPWVETVRIKQFFPSRLLIEIAERVPVAWFIGVDNRARIVDAQGRVLAVEDGQPTEYLQITGVGPNLSPGNSAGALYKAAAQLATGLPDELAILVLNVGTGGPNQLVMTLRSGTLVNFGEPVDVLNKLISLVVLLRRQDSKQIISIDLSNPDIPTVQSK